MENYKILVTVAILPALAAMLGSEELFFSLDIHRFGIIWLIILIISVIAYVSLIPIFVLNGIHNITDKKNYKIAVLYFLLATVQVVIAFNPTREFIASMVVDVPANNTLKSGTPQSGAP